MVRTYVSDRARKYVEEIPVHRACHAASLRPHESTVRYVPGTGSTAGISEPAGTYRTVRYNTTVPVPCTGAGLQYSIPVRSTRTARILLEESFRIQNTTVLRTVASRNMPGFDLRKVASKAGRKSTI